MNPEALNNFGPVDADFLSPCGGRVVLGPLQVNRILEACTHLEVFVHRLDGGQHFQRDSKAPCDRQGCCLSRSIGPTLLKEDLHLYLPHAETAERELLLQRLPKACNPKHQGLGAKAHPPVGGSKFASSIQCKLG